MKLGTFMLWLCSDGKEMYKKSVMRIQSCLFANETYCFFAVLIVISTAIAKAPYWHKAENS